MAHDAHTRQIAHHIALLRHADPQALVELREQLHARCYPPPTRGTRLDPAAVVPFGDDRVLTALCERLWPTITAQDS